VSTRVDLIDAAGQYRNRRTIRPYRGIVDDAVYP
jgi:hypothetical protein